MNWVMFFSILTGILAICTAIAQSVKERKDSNDRLADKSQIIQLQKEQYNKLEEINNLQGKIIATNDELLKANRLIKDLNIKQYNYQTGGNSYPYIHPVFTLDNDETPIIGFLINKEGLNPLYNVHVKFWNTDEIEKHTQNGKIAGEWLQRYNYEVGDIFLSDAMAFGQLIKLTDGILKLDIDITTGNGFFVERLLIRQYENGITCAYKVTDMTDQKHQKILKEHCDTSFPKNGNGKIEWY